MKAKVIIIAVLAAVVGAGLYFGLVRHTFLGESKKETPRLFPVCDRCGSKDARWGYIDSTGKLAINFQFEEVEDFSEGLAAVKTGNRWGFIDEEGKFVINPQFDEVGGFAEGLVAVSAGRQWGYIDKSGKYAINPQFYVALIFSEGLAPVGAEGKYGYIDKDGKYAVNPQFDEARWFSDGLAAVKIGDKWGYINRKGKYIVNPQFDETSDTFSEGRSAFRIGDKWGYVDEDGKYVINPQFDAAGKFSEGLAAIQSGSKWGYVDRDGKFAISPQFAKAETFSEGLAAVKVGERWGYIDKTGKIVINPVLSSSAIGEFRRGLARIDSNLYIDAKADWIWPNRKAFQKDSAELYPLLDADLPPKDSNADPLDGTWAQCVNNVSTRPLCFVTRKGDPTSYGKIVFHDRKSSELAAKLQFDAIFFDNGDGHILFAMKPTPDGWVPYPGFTPMPFMLETVPDLPSLPEAGNGANGAPVTPVSTPGVDQ